MKKKDITDLKVLARIRYINHELRRDRKRKKDIFDKLDSILSKRIKMYMAKIHEFQFLTNHEYDEYVGTLWHQVHDRFLDSTLRKIEYSIDNKKEASFDLYDVQYLIDEIEKILCYVDKRFISVVPLKIRNQFLDKPEEIQKTSNPQKSKLSNRADPNQELANAHGIIKQLKQKMKYPNILPKNELMRFADSSRKKNGKINYSKIGREVGRSHNTIKSWCQFYGIE